MRFNRILFALCATSMLLSACGEDTGSDTTETENPCPALEGEKHLTQADSEGGASLMLHAVGRECLAVGPNTLAIRYYDPERAAAHNMAANYEPAMMMEPGDPTYVVEAVRASMPSMGHGTNEDPVVPGDSNQFEVNFQMAGEWQVEVDFHQEATVAVTEPTMSDTISFTVTVK